MRIEFFGGPQDGLVLNVVNPGTEYHFQVKPNLEAMGVTLGSSTLEESLKQHKDTRAIYGLRSDCTKRRRYYYLFKGYGSCPVL